MSVYNEDMPPRRTDFDDVSDGQDQLLGRFHDVLVEAVLDTIRGNTELLQKYQLDDDHMRSVAISALAHMIGDMARLIIDPENAVDVAQFLFKIDGMVRAAANIKHRGVLH